MSKLNGWRRHRKARIPACPQIMIERDLAQRHHHSYPSEQTELLDHIRSARIEFFGQRLITWRGTPYYSRDVAVTEPEAVAAMGRVRLIGKLEPIEGFIEPISAAVSGEDPTCAIAAVRSRGEPNDEETGLRITEPRHWSSPIGPLTELATFCPGDRFSMRDQSRTPPAARDSLMQHGEILHRMPV